MTREGRTAKTNKTEKCIFNEEDVYENKHSVLQVQCKQPNLY